MNATQLKELDNYSEMHEKEREFLLQAIAKHKPKKILEIGVAAGANSAMILDFLERENLLKKTQLHSIDYCEAYYRDLGDSQKTQNPRKCGFLVYSLTPHLARFWHFYSGGLACNFMERVGDGIDFCIIDTMHIAPGEAMDFLMAYPFLAPNAVIVLHDLTFHILWNPRGNICALVFNALYGEKILPEPYPLVFKTQVSFNDGIGGFLYQNIGLCKLTSASWGGGEHLKGKLKTKNAFTQEVHQYLRLLNIPWVYMPNERDLADFRAFLVRYYGVKYAEFFDSILAWQRRVFLQNEISKMLENAIAKGWDLNALKIDGSAEFIAEARRQIATITAR